MQVRDPNGCLRTVDSTEPSLFGSIPQMFLDSCAERVRDLMQSGPEAPTLRAMVKPLANAAKLYKKTRPGASREAVRKAKEMGKEGPHPFLAAQLPDSGRITLGAEIELQVRIHAARELCLLRGSKPDQQSSKVLGGLPRLPPWPSVIR